MCPTANRLRATWYAIAARLDWYEDGLEEKLFLDHERPAYQRARQAYVNHRLTCLECQASMTSITPAPVERPRPQIKAFEEVLT